MNFLTDDQQNLRVFYHGTRRDFDCFKPNAIGLIHFSSSMEQAMEFAMHARGDPALPVGAPRVIRAHLRARRVFDCANQADLVELEQGFDWDLVARQAGELSQSDWTGQQARKWLEEGAWQILELPCVLGKIRERADALVVNEMGVRNLAVFSPGQVRVVGWDLAGNCLPRRHGP